MEGESFVWNAPPLLYCYVLTIRNPQQIGGYNSPNDTFFSLCPQSESDITRILVGLMAMGLSYPPLPVLPCVYYYITPFFHSLSYAIKFEHRTKCFLSAYIHSLHLTSRACPWGQWPWDSSQRTRAPPAVLSRLGLRVKPWPWDSSQTTRARSSSCGGRRSQLQHGIQVCIIDGSPSHSRISS
jgi:hypothetical protein